MTVNPRVDDISPGLLDLHMVARSDADKYCVFVAIDLTYLAKMFKYRPYYSFRLA